MQNIKNLTEIKHPTIEKDIMSIEQMEQCIEKIIQDKNLVRDKHPFFKGVKIYIETNKMIPLKSAFEIARHWEVITKTFMFTTLASIGLLAKQLAQSKTEISPSILSVFQTGIKVISDDLSNHHAAFSQTAPKGPAGIHYKWWSDEIVAPLAEKLGLTSWMHLPLSENAVNLIAAMHELAENPFGFAVQLRLVEAIALEIAIAFRDIFLHTSHNENKIFSHRSQLSWITSHIKAEVSHHHDVSDMNIGMSALATNMQEQQEFLVTIDWYADLWTKALQEFYDFLDSSSNKN